MVRVRRFRWSDLDGVLAVRNACVTAGAGQGPATREGLAAYWSQGGVRAERDVWVVQGQDDLLAYGGLRPWHSPGWLQVEVAVLPAWRGQGLGGALLRRLSDDARQRRTAYLCAVAADEPAVAGRFLARLEGRCKLRPFT
ncbi:MAG TPA: GNAT family N-acetyltransferase, partial [Anaerolineae bacterium]|nr:GNAT family N-acetyltransferase [Anaerolineae bacterium]